MFVTLVKLSLLALALPIATLASFHGNPIMNRYPHGIAKRAAGNVQLFKRVSNARWSFYNAETGNALVNLITHPSPYLWPLIDAGFFVQRVVWTNALKQRFRMF